eukprot:scaffold297329_cov27-Tisochrysis_lutea.AAC.4
MEWLLELGWLLDGGATASAGPDAAMRASAAKRGSRVSGTNAMTKPSARKDMAQKSEQATDGVSSCISS